MLICFLTPFSLLKDFVKSDVFATTTASQSSPTYVSGIIDTNTTWTVENSPYVVTNNILVEVGATLTITPGVMVKFAGNYYIMVKGALKAEGETSSQIVFTTNSSSPSPGNWRGIQGSTNSELSFRHSIIQYADTGVEAHDANVRISDSEVLCNNVGVSFVNSYEKNTGTIVNNTIRSNDIGVLVNIGGSVGGDVKIENNAVMHNRLGVKITLGGYSVNVTVSQNVISLNTAAGLKVEGLFWTGISPYFVNVSLNYITFNDLGIISDLIQSGAGLWGKFYVEDNDIHSNTEFNFKISHDYAPTHPSADQNASGNYWGTSNTTLIDEGIYDFYDDYTLGRLSYTPILAHPLEMRYPDSLIDPVKPEISISSPFNDSHIESAEVVITWNGQDAGSGIDHYEVRLDESTWINVGTATSFTFTGLSDGTYKVEVKAIDKTLNSSIASVNFIVVTLPLSVTVTANPLTILSSQTSTITTKITYGGNPVSDAIITLSFEPYQGGTLSIITGNTDSNGYFTSTFTAPTVTTQTTITITANATKAGYLSGQSQTQITVNPSQPPPPDLTIWIYIAIVIIVLTSIASGVAITRRKSKTKKEMRVS